MIKQKAGDPVAQCRRTFGSLRDPLALEPTLLTPSPCAPPPARGHPCGGLQSFWVGPHLPGRARWRLGKLPRPSRGRKELVCTVPDPTTHRALRLSFVNLPKPSSNSEVKLILPFQRELSADS